MGVTEGRSGSRLRERIPATIVVLIAAVLTLLVGWTLLYTLLFTAAPDTLGGLCPVDCFMSGVVLMPATVVPLAVGTLLGIRVIRELRPRSPRHPGLAADDRSPTVKSTRVGLGWSSDERSVPGWGTWLAFAAVALLLLVDVALALAALLGLLAAIGVRSARASRGDRVLDGPAGPVVVGRASHGEAPTGPLGAGWASWAPTGVTAAGWDTGMVETLAIQGLLFSGAWLLVGLRLRLAPPAEHGGVTVILPWEPVVYGLALAGCIAVLALVRRERAWRRDERRMNA